VAAIRVLYVQPVAEAGGSDRALLEMVRTLPRGAVEVHIALPGRSPLAGELIATGAVLHEIPMRRITTSGGPSWWVRYALEWPLAVVRLVLLGRRLHVDLVHTNSLHSWYGWAAALLLRRPHVWHAREINVQSGAALRLERFLTAHFAALVPAISRAVAEQLPSPNVRVVHDDVDRERFRPEAAGTFRKEVGIPDGSSLAGVVCRLDTWKGIDVAIDAFTAVRADRPEVELVVVGLPVEGKEAWADELRRRAEAAGARWIGARSDPAAVLADLDVLLALSTEPEPWGLSVAEALAAGCPAIVSDHGGSPEILELAGPGSGAAVTPGEAGPAAAALRTWLAEPTSTDRRQARPRLLPPIPVDWPALYGPLLRSRAGRATARS
jgi:glycosyltransferase involved in cell wall biosynthesis